MIKLGNIEVSDWEICGDIMWCRNIIDVLSHHIQHIHIVQKYNNKYAILITSHTIDECHRKMYGYDMMFIAFKSIEDAKLYVDMFLNKIIKLKAFL